MADGALAMSASKDGVGGVAVKEMGRSGCSGGKGQWGFRLKPDD